MPFSYIGDTKDGESISTANVLSPEGSAIGTYRGDDYYTYLNDIQGSTTNLVKSDGSLAAAYDYTDFGETTEITGGNFDNQICYTGGIYDEETELYYLNARYYDPSTGRFISQDTYRGEMNDPGQWHLYAYCANNPINYVDPSGNAKKKNKSYRPKNGTKVWTCLKVTKKLLKNKIMPYYKHKPTKKALKNWLYETIVAVPYELVIERKLDRLKLKNICHVMSVWGYVETIYDIGNCIYEGQQHKIYLKIKNYYNKYLKNDKDGKKVYFCAEASYRRKGNSGGAYLPTGNVMLTKKSHSH